MITFTINELTAIGNVNILDNGDTIQKCLIQVKINGIVSEDKIISDIIDFTIPNSVMVGSPTPTITGWDYIKNVLAPQWVADNYQQI